MEEHEMIILPFIEEWITLKHPDVMCCLYMISNIGSVKLRSDNTDVKSYLSTNGHVYIALRNTDNELQMFHLGDVVATSFDIFPDNEMIDKPIKIRYRNNDAKDNRPENIEWVEDVEEWKDLSELGFNDGLWKVSSHGNFYGTRYKKFLKQRIGNTGYLRVGGLAIGDKHSIEKFSHRLIAEAFVTNPYPNKYKIVNHIDGDKTHNHYMNLEWVDTSLNGLHTFYLNLVDIKYGEANSSSKLNEEVVHKICQLLLKYDGNIYKVSYETNVNIYAIKAIRNGRSWRHISVNYFPLRNFIKKAPPLDEKFVRIICELLLLKYNMNVDNVYNEICKYKLFNIKKSRILDIIRKKAFVTISNDYF